MSDVSLREYIEAKLEWLDRHVAQRIGAMDTAVRIALDTLNERLKGMNEFRDSLNDLTGRLSTKAEVAALEKALDARVKSLELSGARIAGMAAVIAVIVSAIVSVIVARFL